MLATLALILAAIGVYGVTAYNVSRREREVGIRMALGARITDVLRLCVRDSLRLAAIGTAIGLVLSVSASRVLGSFLFGLTATDGFTFALAAGVLGVIALGASYLPARRASRPDPLAALRRDS